MRHMLVIGIGAGNPEQVTVEAINALRRVDAFFVMHKSGGTQELVDLRAEILDRYAPDSVHRTVEVADPERDRTPAAYRATIEQWRAERSALYAALIRDELGEDETGAFLVWGDPALYDSTVAILTEIAAQGAVPFEVEVIPGISSVQALAARHRIPLNRVGAAVQITPGRRLADRPAPDAEDIVVMLDTRQDAFTAFVGQGVDIYWGAYLGTPDELLVAGPLDDVVGEIRELRRAAKERKGWLFDTYLLRRPIG